MQVISLEDAAGVISDHTLSRLTGEHRSVFQAMRAGKPGVRTDNWMPALDKFGLEPLLEFLMAHHAPGSLMESVRTFYRQRCIVPSKPKRDLPLQRIRKRISRETFTPKEKAELEAAIEANEDRSVPLPATRSECQGGPRPCPLVRCKWHLALDYYENEVTGQGGIIVDPDLLEDPVSVLESMQHTCLLDVIEATEGESTLEEVGAVFDLTRERVRQIEESLLRKLREDVLYVDGKPFDIRVLMSGYSDDGAKPSHSRGTGIAGGDRGDEK